MTIILVGLNHRTTPVELREQLSLAGCGLTMALEELDQAIRLKGRHEQLREAVILSTCNRLEVYAVADGEKAGQAAIEDFLSQLQGIPLAELQPHLYFMTDHDAVAHLMRVASGLDSMILGEPQILGQVSQAIGDARQAGVSGPLLSHLFAQATHAGKRARAETDISRHTTSVSHAAALLAQEKVGDLAEKQIVLIGAGEMAEVAAQALQARGAGEIVCINRTFSRAEALAGKIGGRSVNWYHLPEALAQADVVITATGAPHTIIYASDVEKVILQREERPLLFVDIAVPRDVEEEVDRLPGVIRYDIDDLQLTLDENLAQRQAAIPAVEAIVREEVDAFVEWARSRQVAPVITDLRRRAAEIASAEVDVALRRLDGLNAHEHEIINRLAHRIVNKLLHEPTMILKAQAADGNGYAYAHAVRELFALGEAEQPGGNGEPAKHAGNGHRPAHE